MKKCGLCGFKTEDDAAFPTHMATAHGWGPAGKSEPVPAGRPELIATPPEIVAKGINGELHLKEHTSPLVLRRRPNRAGHPIRTSSVSESETRRSGVGAARSYFLAYRATKASRRAAALSPLDPDVRLWGSRSAGAPKRCFAVEFTTVRSSDFVSGFLAFPLISTPR